MSNNIVLEAWIEIISRPSVRQMDQIMILYRKFDAFMIWELELTLWAVKVLLVDKTKENVIESMLDWELTPESATKVDEWGEKVFNMITTYQEEAKKKSQVQSLTTKKPSKAK